MKGEAILKPDDQPELRQAIEVARRYLQEFEQNRKTTNAHRIVQAVVELTAQNLERPAQERHLRFTALEVWEASTLSRQTHGHNPPVPEDPGRWLRDHWSGVQNFQDKAIRALGVDAKRLNVPVIPWLEKTSDNKGGRGHYAQYWLETRPVVIDQADTLPQGDLCGQSPRPQWRETIEYTPLTVRSLPGLLMPWKGPWTMQGWRRATVAVPLAISAAGLTFSFAALAMALWSALWTGLAPAWLFWGGFWGALVFMPVCALLWPWFALLEHRIVMAPIWLVPLTWEEPFLVMGRAREGRVQDLQAPRIIQMVSYTAHCPLCGALVRIKKGQGPLRGRLVGCCDESPREHVYSFDHVLLTGRHLYP